MRMIEEWTAWAIVHERERELEQRGKVREAERAQEERTRRKTSTPLRAVRRQQHRGRRAA